VQRTNPNMATGCVDPPSNDLQTTANYDIRQLFKPSVLIDLEFHQSMTNMHWGGPMNLSISKRQNALALADNLSYAVNITICAFEQILLSI